MKSLVLLLFGMVLLLGAANLQAGPISCLSTATLQDLINLGSSGCEVQDKIFSNFVYTGSTLASSIMATSHFTVGSGGDQHGWTFAATGGITSSFTLQYTISVDLAIAPAVTIFATQDQMLDGPFVTPTTVLIADVQKAGATTLGTLNLNNSSGSTETAQMFFSPVTSITTTSTVTILPNGILNSYEQIWFEPAPIPEPMSLILFGTGLLLISLTKRLKKR